MPAIGPPVVSRPRPRRCRVAAALRSSSLTAGSTGKWTFTPTGLADGAHSLIASETDAAGKTGSAQVSLTLDTAVPVVTAARTWDTLLNFHAGDMLTLWGYNAASGNVSWSDAMGAAGYQARRFMPASATARGPAPSSPSRA